MKTFEYVEAVEVLIPEIKSTKKMIHEMNCLFE